MELSQISKDFLAVEAVLQERESHTQTVRGRDTPFRVRSSFGRGHLSYRYFCTLEDALRGDGAKSVAYGVTGRAVISNPLHQTIQQRGPRGGWKKYPSQGDSHAG